LRGITAPRAPRRSKIAKVSFVIQAKS